MTIKVGDRLFPRTGKKQHVFIVKELNYRGGNKVLMVREDIPEDKLDVIHTRVVSMDKIHLYDKLIDPQISDETIKSIVKTEKTIEVETHRCSGQCCEMFLLHDGKYFFSKEGFQQYVNNHRNEGSNVDKDNLFILDMIEPLGYKNIDYNLKITNYPYEWFRCRHHDKTTGLCTQYENRPYICHNHPGKEKCPYEGCTRTVKQIKQVENGKAEEG